MDKEWKTSGKHVIILDPQERHHGWIQWKGTDVCIDIHCKCGEMSHFDGMFMYYIKCPYCGQIYEANGHIELVETTLQQIDKGSRSTLIKLGEKD